MKKFAQFLLGFLLLALVASAGLFTVRSTQASTFQAGAKTLEATWTKDISQGVPAPVLAPLRRDLATSPYLHASAFSSLWWPQPTPNLLPVLNFKTRQIYAATLALDKTAAGGVLQTLQAVEQASHLGSTANSFIPPVSDLQSQLQAASTPAAVSRLEGLWTLSLTTLQNQILTASIQTAAFPFGGETALLQTATTALDSATLAHLPTSSLSGVLTTLATTPANLLQDLTAIQTLIQILPPLQSLLAKYQAVKASLANLHTLVYRAATPDSQARYRILASVFSAATTLTALTSLASQIQTYQQQLQLDLSAPILVKNPTPAKTAPSHPSSGKVININLSTQSATFYQNGKLVGSSLITSGMPGLRTPTGTFHVYGKYSPITFISSWPKSSKYYYPPEKANYALRYAAGGFFLHNAPWEPANGFGPGSQNGPSASHGCVHFPTPTMAWLYAWAPLGTTVVIHY